MDKVYTAPKSDLALIAQTYNRCSTMYKNAESLGEAVSETMGALVRYGFSAQDAVSLIDQFHKNYRTHGRKGVSLQDLKEATVKVLEGLSKSPGVKTVGEVTDLIEQMSSFDSVEAIGIADSVYDLLTKEYSHNLKNIQGKCEHPFREGRYCPRCGIERRKVEINNKPGAEPPRGLLKKIFGTRS